MDCSSDAALFTASVVPVASGAAGETDRVDLLLGPVCRPRFERFPVIGERGVSSGPEAVAMLPATGDMETNESTDTPASLPGAEETFNLLPFSFDLSRLRRETERYDFERLCLQI